MWGIFNLRQFETADHRRVRAEKKHLRERHKARLRRKRTEFRRDVKKRFYDFLAHPFAQRKPNSAERATQRFKRQVAHDRTIERRKWLARFRNDPWSTVFQRKKHRSTPGGYHDVFRKSRNERKELARQKRKQLRGSLSKILSTPDLCIKFGFAYLHSTAYFILAFMLLYIIYQAVTIIIASSYNIPIVWYYYQLQFPLYTYSPLYTRMAMVVIFASGPILSLLLAFLFLRFYFIRRTAVRRFRLFYLWGFICGINMFFGAYIAGVFTRTEFIYVSEWLFMSNVFAAEESIFTLIAIFTLIITGRIITPLFLKSSNSVTMIKPEFRLFFILAEVIFPWITGMIILFLITLPNYYLPLILKTISPGLILIPTLFLYNAQKFDKIPRSGVIQHTYFRWSIILIVIAILFFYRVILSFGLRVS